MVEGLDRSAALRVLGEGSVQSRVLGKARRSKKFVVSPICLSSEGGVGMAELGTEWAREKSSKL